MATISLCMIVKNEQAVLERCLKSVLPLVDEIIIVDTGSMDNTKNIAEKYGKVYDFSWCDDFSAARNFSFSKATMDYILWLDADDVLPEKYLNLLIDYKKNMTADVIMIKYHLNIDKNGNAGFVYYRERILKRTSDFVWQGAVHECITPSGKIEYLDAAIEHHSGEKTLTDRNLKIYTKLLERDGKLDTRGVFYYARELQTHKRYHEAIESFNDFLSRDDGWIQNKLEAYRNISTCYNALGDTENAKISLFSSFLICPPTAETCCALAGLFIKDNNYNSAVFWYKIAFNQSPNTENGGFVQTDCYDFLPCIGLCVCYDRLGKYDKAIYWNEKAALYKPDNPAVLSNREYLCRVTNSADGA